MKKIVMMMAVIAGLTCVSLAEETNRPFSVGLKVWNASTSWNGEEALLYGPLVGMELSNNIWISAMGTFGTVVNAKEADAEIVLGRTFRLFDAGIGMRYISTTFHHNFIDFWGIYHSSTVQRYGYGPMLYVGTGSTFGNAPIGWYAGGSLVPVTFGTADKASHANLEGGLYGSWDRWMVTLGYRFKRWLDSDSDEKGVTASVAFKF